MKAGESGRMEAEEAIARFEEAIARFVQASKDFAECLTEAFATVSASIEDSPGKAEYDRYKPQYKMPVYKTDFKKPRLYQYRKSKM